MAIDWTNVSALDASLATVPAPAQATILAYVTATLPAARWGEKLDLASTFLAAHMGAMVLRGAGGAVGPVMSESLGDASRSYGAAIGGAMLDLGATAWGQVYRRMIRELGVIAIVG